MPIFEGRLSLISECLQLDNRIATHSEGLLCSAPIQKNWQSGIAPLNFRLRSIGTRRHWPSQYSTGQSYTLHCCFGKPHRALLLTEDPTPLSSV